MVRTQIQLTEQQARRLRDEARERGVSLAEIVRRCVERGLADDAPNRAALYDRAARVVGRFPDRRGSRDISLKHDHINVVWVDEALHEAGLDLLLGRRKRLLSLVDAVSFVTMRQRRVAEVFAFDPQFRQEGFSMVS